MNKIRVSLELDPDVALALATKAQRWGISLNTLLRASFRLNSSAKLRQQGGQSQQAKPRGSF